MEKDYKENKWNRVVTIGKHSADFGMFFILFYFLQVFCKFEIFSSKRFLSRILSFQLDTTSSVLHLNREHDTEMHWKILPSYFEYISVLDPADPVGSLTNKVVVNDSHVLY